MKIITLLSLLALAWTSGVLSSAAAQTSPVRGIDEFNLFYEKGMKDAGQVGGGVAIVRNNKLVDLKCYGLANIEKKQPVDGDTIFHWASITKTFTGIAIMQLRDRGLLSLDDPIVRYVPELRVAHNPYGPMEKITIRQLLSHSAGFRNGTWPWGGDKDWEPAEPPGWSQLTAMMPYTEVLFQPGSKYSYSNPGIVYLGRVIELLSHEDYEVYIDKNILRPLGMHRSYFDRTPDFLIEHRSHSYEFKDGRLNPGRFDMDTGVTVSNGGLNSPLNDMVRYLNFLLGDPSRQSEYDRILKRASLLEMWQPVLPVPEEDKGSNRKDYIGLCFFIEDNYGKRFIGHSGHQNFFASHFYLDLSTNSAYIIAFNSYAPPGQANAIHDTDKLDLRIKNYLFERIFQ